MVLMSLAANCGGDTSTNVLRATLDNGLRVVIVRDPLAPVATLEENYLAGGQDTPPGFPGMAHAQEHMAFRSCAGVSADQIAAIYAQLGGSSNADTQQNITQYFVTVPAQDLEVALRLDSACMPEVEDSQEQWAEERGAIEQEVSRDLSNSTYMFVTRLNEDLFSGTAYAHGALGTKASFDATTGAMLKKFYRDWYAPNNAILVITGDVDPAAVLARVRQLYGPIKRRTVPAHLEIALPPIKPESFTLDSNLPYQLVFVAFRMPGTSSSDFAAARIPGDVASSQRAGLYGLVPRGKALGTEFGLTETYPKASVGYAAAAVPSGADPTSIIAEIKKILAGYADKGVPPALVEAAKKSEIRAAKKYLTVEKSGFGGAEVTTAAPTKPLTLPDWAEASVKSLKLPPASPPASDITLSNPKTDPTLREATPKSISALTLADIKNYYSKVFRPDLTTIAVVGDITAGEARPVFEKWFGSWKATGPRPNIVLREVPANGPAAINVPDTTQVQDSVNLSEQLGINRFHPDYYALQLGDHVLGGGFYATRLYRDLRQKAGLVYTVDNALGATETRATYSVNYGCDAKNVSQARVLIEQELAAMRSTNVTSAELQQAKALLLRQTTRAESSEEMVARGLVARALLDLPLDEPARAARRYYALTADDVRKAFEKWIRPDAFVQVVRGPAPR